MTATQSQTPAAIRAREYRARKAAATQTAPEAAPAAAPIAEAEAIVQAAGAAVAAALPQTPDAPEFARETIENITVDAQRRRRVLRTIDGEGNPVAQAEAVVTDYESKVKRMEMVPVDGGKPASLGIAANLWQLVDHYDVAKPLMQNGFTHIELLNHRSGGADMSVLLSNPAIKLADVIDWDAGRFPERDRDLHLAARVDTSYRAGHAIRIDFGFFRVLCTNGLVSRVFEMGGRSFRHTDWETRAEGEELGAGPTYFAQQAQVLTEALEDADGDVRALPQFAKALPGDSLEWGIEQVSRYLDAKDEAGRYEMLRTLPEFARDPLKQLMTRTPSWAGPVLLDVMGDMRRADHIGSLDLVNAVTDLAALVPAHVRARTETSWSVYERLEPLAQHLKALVEIGAFRKHGSVEYVTVN